MSSYLSSFTAFSNPRRITYTSQLPHSTSTIFSVLTSVQSYQHFLPLTTSSTVLTRDAESRPIKFKLKVGYPDLGIYEDWVCRISRQDSAAGVVEYAREDSNAASVLEKWSVKWTIQASKLANPILKLDITLQFKSNFYDQAFLLQNQVAPNMMAAFARRMAEVEEREGKEAAERLAVEKAKAEKAKQANEVKQKLMQASKPVPKPKEATAPAVVAARKAPKKLEIRSEKRAA